KVARADYNLVGIELPTGARRVELRFTDAAYGTGAVVTMVSLAASLALVVLGIVMAPHVDGGREAAHPPNTLATALLD
ncbi:MAG TPA: hypothetical protein VF488_04415, partial [Gemmatimonadaceae bacterium]